MADEKRFVCERRQSLFIDKAYRYRVVDTGNEKRPIICFTHLQESGDLICDALNYFMGKIESWEKAKADVARRDS